ncbi:MAG: polyprenyl synthetase family protein [Burkholderiales bacterium]|nr:polyprenyl synthetase family protein [Burkholderiales bacterium]
MANTKEAMLKIIEPVSADLVLLDEAVKNDLKSDIELIQRICDYILSSGGKRIRPLVLILIARALGYKGKEHIFLGAMVEYIHTASLLHDDVVDESDVRRGKPTASFKWGNSAAVLTGDFMYSRSFEMMVRTGNLRICEIVAGSVNRISEGEVIQLLNIHDTTLDEKRYFEVIERKTGILFESAARLAAVVAGATREQENRLADYALSLGRAFQIIDDVLDYAGDVSKTGKALGNDLKESKMTMPLIYALQNCSPEDAQIIRNAIGYGEYDLDQIIGIIKNSGAIERCFEAARHELQKGTEAISFLPPSNYKNSLIELLTLTVERDK